MLNGAWEILGIGKATLPALSFYILQALIAFGNIVNPVDRKACGELTDLLEEAVNFPFELPCEIG